MQRARLFFLNLYNFIYLFIDLLCENSQASAHVWRSEDYTKELVLSFHRVLMTECSSSVLAGKTIPLLSRIIWIYVGGAPSYVTREGMKRTCPTHFSCTKQCRPAWGHSSQVFLSSPAAPPPGVLICFSMFYFSRSHVNNRMIVIQKVFSNNSWSLIAHKEFLGYFLPFLYVCLKCSKICVTWNLPSLPRWRLHFS